MLPFTTIISASIELIAKKRIAGELRAGDFILYSVWGTMKGQEIRGGVMIKFTKVTKNAFTVKVVPKKVPSMKEVTLEFPYNGKSLADLGGIIAGWSVLYQGSHVGKEVMTTPFGERELEHYMKIDDVDTGTLKVDQYVDTAYKLPYASLMSGQSGEVGFSITETNIEWIKG